MNFLPSPASGSSVSCSMRASYPVFWLFALQRTWQSHSISYSLSLLKLQLLILTILSSLHTDTLKTHFENEAKERKNQNSLNKPEHSSSYTSKGQAFRRSDLRWALCLSALHLSAARRRPSLNWCDRTVSELTTASKCCSCLLCLDLSTAFDV